MCRPPGRQKGISPWPAKRYSRRPRLRGRPTFSSPSQTPASAMSPSQPKHVQTSRGVSSFVRKYRRLMALLVCLSLFGGLVYYLNSGPVYHSTARVKFEDRSTAADAENAPLETRIAAV